LIPISFLGLNCVPYELKGGFGTFWDNGVEISGKGS